MFVAWDLQCPDLTTLVRTSQSIPLSQIHKTDCDFPVATAAHSLFPRHSGGDTFTVTGSSDRLLKTPTTM
jgi:hypothetical protein